MHICGVGSAVDFVHDFVHDFIESLIESVEELEGEPPPQPSKHSIGRGATQPSGQTVLILISPPSMAGDGSTTRQLVSGFSTPQRAAA